MESRFRAFNRGATNLCLRLIKIPLASCVQTAYKWDHKGDEKTIWELSEAGQARDKSISDLGNASVSAEKKEGSGDAKR